MERRLTARRPGIRFSIPSATLCSVVPACIVNGPPLPSTCRPIPGIHATLFMREPRDLLKRPVGNYLSGGPEAATGPPAAKDSGTYRPIARPSRPRPRPSPGCCFIPTTREAGGRRAAHTARQLRRSDDSGRIHTPGRRTLHGGRSTPSSRLVGTIPSAPASSRRFGTWAETTGGRSAPPTYRG